MRIVTILLLQSFFLVPVLTSAQQQATVLFSVSHDTLNKSSNEQSRIVEFTVPKQKKFHGSTITLQLSEDKTNIPEREIAISTVRSVKVDSNQNKTLQVKIYFTRNQRHERTITLHLAGSGKNGKPIGVTGITEYELYIEPFQPNATAVATSSSQTKNKVKAYFKMDKDTLKSSEKGDSRLIEFTVPKQKNLAGAKVSVKLDNTGTNIPESEIVFSSLATINVDSVQDKSIKVKLGFTRSTTLDRTIKLKLVATNKSDEQLPLIDSAISYELYIHPYKEDADTKAADKIKAYFNPVKDTVSEKLDDTVKTVQVIIPKQPKFHNSNVNVSVDASITNIPLSDIHFPPTNLSTITVDSTKVSDTTTMTFTISRNEKKYERNIILKLTANNDDGEKLELVDSATTYNLYYIPYSGDSLRNSNNEYWFFTGTNVDLLDGFKPKELYFKGSFLFPVYPKKPKKDLLYLTFEKNRYFKEKDSLFRIPLSDRIFVPGQPDTVMTIVRGQYSSLRETVTENVGLNIAYLWNFDRTAKSDYNFYGVGGFSVDHQKIKITYEHKNILSDTSVAPRRDTFFRPLLTEDRIQQWGGNFYVGFMFIHSGEDVNLKVFLNSGLAIFHSPQSRVRTSTTEFVKYKTDSRVYTRLRIDATLIASPGISIGGEMFFRSGEIPLFNFTVSKVIDYRQIAALFGKVPSVK